MKSEIQPTAVNVPPSSADKETQVLSFEVSPATMLKLILMVRDGKETEVSLKLLVPGDIIRLAAGDMVPADVHRITMTPPPVPHHYRAAP